MSAAPASFLRTLCTLRWYAVAGQAVSIALSTVALEIALPAPPLWGGVAALALFNAWAIRVARRPTAAPATVFSHMLVDIAVLAWLVAWSGGIANPFSSMLLIPIALAAPALPPRWVWATAAACLLGFALATLLARPLPHLHGDAFNLHLWGMAVNFVVSAAVVLFFSLRLVSALRRQERELALLRERFARNEGIVALATHAAAVAHELNTPLATMTLLADEIAEEAGGREPDIAADATTLRALIDQCRDRVRALASPADPGHAPGVRLGDVVERWQLVRPEVTLMLDDRLPPQLRVEAAVGHLLQALLNNAADAGHAAGRERVELRLDADLERGWLFGEVRDHGDGFDEALPFAPDGLFRSSKPDGMGVGLALSHATVDRLGGHLSMRHAEPGLRVRFELPIEPPAQRPLREPPL
ncbi:ATP-binding protein [Marilutibacter maris]|uniref:histidine kinase n=1 Tax=Marilutibacter maris TaxID=1605891 RepID=A0A2U9T9V9_9GAMM|nr:ATP-binding protein [Lysobacter maris]AWV07674.1 two-component system sensor protein [Lysobacter maris]